MDLTVGLQSGCANYFAESSLRPAFDNPGRLFTINSMPSDSLRSTLNRLESWFRQQEGVLVAFSGGVDSSLVAYLANKFMGNDRCMAVISASPSLKMSELDGARAFARAHGIPLEVIVTREMENPNYTSNPVDRCYYCKHTLYTELESMRNQYPGWLVVNGQNTDDLGDYRPGLKAAKEFEVRAPLGECEIDKAMVREVAAHFNLACWDKPASPCLASRVPYGEEVTIEKLRQIERAEAVLADHGFPVCRVRHFGEAARIEVPPETLESLNAKLGAIQVQLLGIGFARAEVDPEGFVSGKLNRVLDLA